MTVLNVMEDQQLMENAQNLGTFLANGFRQLQKSHSVIGNLRISMLNLKAFINVDKISNRKSLVGYTSFKPGSSSVVRCLNLFYSELMMSIQA